MERGCLDFKRLQCRHTAGAYFVIRAKSNNKFKRRRSRLIEMSAGARCDHTVVLTGLHSTATYSKHYFAHTPMTVKRKNILIY